MNPTGIAPRSGGDRLWSVLCHLSAFLGFPFLLPLIVYLVMKDEAIFVAHHASEALNFHLSLLIYGLGVVALVLLGPVGMVLALTAGGVLAVTALVCSVVGAIKASENRSYFYPMSLRLIGR